jgi:uncharacterized LabA/DUF88 family protein
MSQSNGRVAIFVDVQNLFYVARNTYSAKVDYKKLLGNLVGNSDQLMRCIAYVVQRPDVPQDKFIDALESIGYEVHIKSQLHNKKDSDGKVIREKLSYELLLGIDAISIAPKVDTVILVTGDGTYTPLVQYLKTVGCKVLVAGFENSTSRDLQYDSDGYIRMTKDWTFLPGIEETVVGGVSTGAELEIPEDVGNRK